MTRWTIDGTGDTGTRAHHYYTISGAGSFGRTYNVSRLPSGFWLAEYSIPGGEWVQLDASEMTEAGAQARCEMHAANSLTIAR